jgi:hypothetical protein
MCRKMFPNNNEKMQFIKSLVYRVEVWTMFILGQFYVVEIRLLITTLIL